MNDSSTCTTPDYVSIECVVKFNGHSLLCVSVIIVQDQDYCLVNTCTVLCCAVNNDICNAFCTVCREWLIDNTIMV